MAEIQQPTVVMDGDWLALDFENYEGRECIKEHMLLNSDKKEDLARWAEAFVQLNPSGEHQLVPGSSARRASQVPIAPPHRWSGSEDGGWGMRTSHELDGGASEDEDPEPWKLMISGDARKAPSCKDENCGCPGPWDSLRVSAGGPMNCKIKPVGQFEGKCRFFWLYEDGILQYDAKEDTPPYKRNKFQLFRDMRVHYDLDQDDKNMIVGNKRRHIRLKFKDQETLEEWASKLVDAIKMEQKRANDRSIRVSRTSQAMRANERASRTSRASRASRTLSEASRASDGDPMHEEVQLVHNTTLLETILPPPAPSFSSPPPTPPSAAGGSSTTEEDKDGAVLPQKPDAPAARRSSVQVGEAAPTFLPAVRTSKPAPTVATGAAADGAAAEATSKDGKAGPNIEDAIRIIRVVNRMKKNRASAGNRGSNISEGAASESPQLGRKISISDAQDDDIGRAITKLDPEGQEGLMSWAMSALAYWGGNVSNDEVTDQDTSDDEAPRTSLAAMIRIKIALHRRLEKARRKIQNRQDAKLVAEASAVGSAWDFSSFFSYSTGPTSLARSSSSHVAF